MEALPTPVRREIPNQIVSADGIDRIGNEAVASTYDVFVFDFNTDSVPAQSSCPLSPHGILITVKS